MPLPKPKPNENHDDFLSRCMANPTMNEDYPENDQRYAVCISLWDKGDKMEILTQELIDGLSKKTYFNNFEIKSKGNRGFFKGFASSYDLDEGGDRVIAGAFYEDLPKFMENPVMLFSHQLDKVIGSWKKLEEQEKGLYGEAEINLNTQLGKDVYALINDGDLKGLSIGYQVKQADIDKVTGVRLLIKVKLWEISVVAIPMNQSAWIAGTKIFTGVDLAPKEPEFTFKFKHKDDDLKFEDVAVDWYTLFEKSCDNRLETAGHLIEHYEKLGKAVPLLNGGMSYLEADIKDFAFTEDEPYIMEQLRFNGSLSTIVNLAKHWKDEGRSQSELENSVSEALKSISELLPQANEDKEANPVNNKDDIVLLSKAITEATSKIANVSNFEKTLKDSVKTLINEALSKATGKEIK